MATQRERADAERDSAEDAFKAVIDLQRENARLRSELEAAEQSLSEAFIKGVASVTTIRCVKHSAIPAYNLNEGSGGECAACTVLALQAQHAQAVAALERMADGRGGTPYGILSDKEQEARDALALLRSTREE